MEIDYGITKWKITSYIIGAIGIGIGPLFLYYFFEYVKFDPLIYVILVINLITSILWVSGAVLSRTGYMLLLLVWWLIPVLICLVYFFLIVIFEILSKDNKHFLRDLAELFFELLTWTILVLAIYTLALISYVGLKKAINRSRSVIPRMNVEYSVAKNRDYY